MILDRGELGQSHNDEDEDDMYQYVPYLHPDECDGILQHCMH